MTDTPTPAARRAEGGNSADTRFQAAFFAALRGARSALPQATLPAFAVYRNTVASACADALAANFPSVVRLVGADWFSAAALAYVAQQPPDDGRLLLYGAGFADFLAGWAPAQDLPYLPGVARLDRAWIECHVAADAEVADARQFAADAEGEPSRLARLVLRPHPAARWFWFDDAPVASIWQRQRAHDDDRGDGDCSDIAWQPEGLLLTRPSDQVQWLPIGPPQARFLDACAAGWRLVDAAEAAFAPCAAGAADFATLFAALLRAGALAAPLVLV